MSAREETPVDVQDPASVRPRESVRYSTEQTRALEDELVGARAELAETIDALAERLDPRRVASRAAHSASTFVRSAVARPGEHLGVWGVVGAVAAVVALRAWRARHQR